MPRNLRAARRTTPEPPPPYPLQRPHEATSPRRSETDTSPKYLYLREQSHADTWLAGGDVPINPASSYRSDTREATLTPDEVVQSQIRGDAGLEFPTQNGIRFGEGPAGVTFIDSTFGGVRKRFIQYERALEDSLILCLCNVYDETIMRRLGHSVAVRIPSIDLLRQCLDPQVGVPSQHGLVAYTSEPGNRHHFLKSTADAWQQEYRLAWVGNDLGTKQKWVTLGRGLAEPV